MGYTKQNKTNNMMLVCLTIGDTYIKNSHLSGKRKRFESIGIDLDVSGDSPLYQQNNGDLTNKCVFSF